MGRPNMAPGAVAARLSLALLAATLAMLAAGCTRQTGRDALALRATGADGREAPMLAELVRQGKLPPLDQRLPEDPMVVEPLDEPGIYGGTWRRCHMSPDMPDLKMEVLYNPLVRWRADCQGVVPGLAASWDANTDSTVYTLHLRRGVRWSDGAPYTSEDFMFWWELCLDKRHFFEPPYFTYSAGQVMRVGAPDPFTLRLTFARPNYFLPLDLASGYWWNEQYNIPKHYMRQFHPDHNPAYTDFVVFNEKNIVHSNPDRPTLAPWHLATLDKAATRVIYERNPYYWAVDTSGRQLPYIDRIETTYAQTAETLLLKAMAGELDCQFRNIDLEDAALLHQFAGKGGYELRRWESAAGTDPGVLINWTPPDPKMRDLFRDKRFRRALSHAINRQRINQVAWSGLGVPQGGTVSRQAWHFASTKGRQVYDAWAKAHADYDPGKASAYLDDVGLSRRDSQGLRTWPDGTEFRLILDSADTGRENDVAVLIAEDWRAVGIRTIIYTPPLAERTNRHQQGTFDLSMRGTSEMDLFTYPDWVFPTRALYWHPKEGRWYETGGKDGEAPTGPLRTLVDLFDTCKAEPDLQKRHDIVLQAIQVHIDEGPFYLGTCADLPALVVVRHGFRNVPATGILGPWAVGQPGSLFPEQFCMLDESATSTRWSSRWPWAVAAAR